MKLPTGIVDFASIRKENYFYVDKTKYIAELEQMGKYLFFIRPRRFGKTLLLSTLEYYYDIRHASQFADLFNGLYIGKNPTELRNSYFVLFLDFSGLKTHSEDSIEDSFRKSLLRSLINFFHRNRDSFLELDETVAELKEETDLKSMLNILYNAVEMTGNKLYIIIDEYDQFANDLLATGDGKYYRETIRARGFVRDFYETLKIGTRTVVDRIFITGISPIMLDDLTSGFNITINLTVEPNFNEMLGFTEEEVDRIIQQAVTLLPEMEPEKLKNQLREYYNGYLFNEECTTRMYNPDMVIYYFRNLIMYKNPPRELITDNVKTDYGRLERLIMHEQNREMLENIIKEERIVADIITKFSFDRMYDHNYFVSLLFYMGLLTIEKRVRTKLYLKIPNWVIKTVFWEYFDHLLQEKYQLNLLPEELKDAIEKLAYDGKIEPYIKYVSQNILQILANMDLRKFDEKYIKLVLITYLVHQKIYKPKSEVEVEGGYVDLYLEKNAHFPHAQYEWLWELKYLKVSDKDKLEEVKEKGLAQLKKYAESRRFIDRKDVKMALIIFIGKNEYVVEML